MEFRLYSTIQTSGFGEKDEKEWKGEWGKGEKKREKG